MERKDHLQLVTDAGVTLNLGWDYGIPYNIDPLNGVPVDLQLAQGVNQVGQTVEQQSVAGVYREIKASFKGENGDADAEFFLQMLPYKTGGTLYFGDKWFCRFVVSKTPYTIQLHPFPRLDFMVFCPKPFWYALEASNYTLGGFEAAFSFPVNYEQPHYFATRNADASTNVRNAGSLPVPFTAILRCETAVENPRIRNTLTGQSIGFLTTLKPGQVIEVYRTTTDRLAVKRTEGETEENFFWALDEDSDLMELAPGDNFLKTEADNGTDNLQVLISFYPMYSGILPEVIPL